VLVFDTRIRLLLVPLAAVLTWGQARAYIAFSIPLGGILGFAGAVFYEPFSAWPVDHIRVAAYCGFLAGWFALFFCGFLALFPLD
jgi:hypothetical protein